MRAEPVGNGYVYDERYFNSFQEVQCYRYLKHLGIHPGKVHHEYQVGGSRFDFFPLRRVFWEHHPINLKLGQDIYRYGKRRRAILDGNGYNNVPLVVSDVMFEDVTDICKAMSDHGVDFRTGEVPGDRELVFVKRYEDEFRLEMLSLIHASLLSD
ncbi:hypothetical protein A3K69_00830 [Candidatus Bathyarchaeota archaeon RBG_16_57_9]|nr:MAG: hypothetical protein A3K69_00830 [Candidatus Bathyarchaeota archaeon RBG_16_57_9]OGD52285.1 MAG: hypothetical protein A3K81_01345 [Candidatus Bathyarchaeota archaeon RBG_13_60_20]